MAGERMTGESWPPPWFGSVQAGRADTAERTEEILAAKFGSEDERRPVLVVAPTYRWFADWCRKEGIARRDAVYVHRPEGLQGLGSGREVVVVDGYRCPAEVIEVAYALRESGRITIRPATA